MSRFAIGSQGQTFAGGTKQVFYAKLPAAGTYQVGVNGLVTETGGSTGDSVTCLVIDKAAIDAKVQALAQASQKLGEKVYADQSKAQGAPGGEHQQAQGAAPGGGAAQQEKEVEGNVVDAEYTEVKDKKSA